MSIFTPLEFRISHQNPIVFKIWKWRFTERLIFPEQSSQKQNKTKCALRSRHHCRSICVVRCVFYIYLEMIIIIICQQTNNKYSRLEVLIWKRAAMFCRSQMSNHHKKIPLISLKIRGEPFVPFHFNSLLCCSCITEMKFKLFCIFRVGFWLKM